MKTASDSAKTAPEAPRLIGVGHGHHISHVLGHGGGCRPPRSPPRCRPCHHRRIAVDGRARRHHRQHRLAAYPERTEVLRHQPDLGVERLHADLRRTAAPRWSRRRHPRAAPGLHVRYRAVHLLLAARRLRHLGGLVAVGASTAGDRRRYRVANRPLADHHELRGRCRAQPCVWCLRRRFRCRCRRGPSRGRHADVVVVVALGLLREHPDRHLHRLHRAAVHQRIREDPRQVRRLRRDRLHARNEHLGLRLHPGRLRRLG
jgi:hypothetical protein